MKQNEVRSKIETAYKKLLKKDLHLLEKDVNERSITHKLAEYLQSEFSEYHVDCEYNRNGLNKKVIDSFKEDIKSDDVEAVTVYPDIIIHHRGTNDNLVVIEAKKNHNQEDDKKKLKLYIDILKYEFAYCIRFPIKQEVKEFAELRIDEFIELVTQSE
jgi:hypothetical protein